ncbi:immunoglobulin superfamily member 3-like isoform X2 [Parambassis ranga]|uniref:immunoglobulin superfamily member 3-like isoform X2 n=1 Tax=Parambassis ranga TaxID=210632 RepID=UPI00104254B5|nr:immunoglobulin superfamily member 3-like isoform X2 [Parambassis ranga]
MRCSPLSSLRANLLLCLALLLQCGEARVYTEIQAGPLYRVVGHPLFISCNVSGFTNERSDKDFEFRIAKPSRPTFEINIISTRDPTFSYAVYGTRVSSQEISLKRVSPNSVVFEIQRLEKGDEGEFDCTVVNSESIFDGTYSVKSTVRVIDNSLSVSLNSPTSLSFNEGEPLTLTCQASSNTIQHTHLSLTWFLRKDGAEDAQPIISLDRDFTLRPGQGFKERYQEGLISLDKLGEATYRLKMAQLQLSDQGEIFCQAQEWIQDPDRSWYAITQKDAKEITLQVKAREVAPDTSSVVVKILAQPSALQEGQTLLLSCNIDSQNLGERFFSVAWLRGSVELARIGPLGVLSVGPEYSGREKEGELRASRNSKRDYRLILQPVRIEDQGQYVCRAWAQERGNDGVFTQGAAQDSSSQLVSISATESGLSVKMSDAVSVTERDTLRLACKVAGVKGQLSVTWQRKPTQSAPFTNVISLNQEGVTEKAEEFTSRKVRATRTAADSFVLEVDEVTPSDAGVYQCAVSEWNTNSKVFSQSQTANVMVQPIDSKVKAHLIIRNNRVTVGENVELMCRVKGPRVPVTLTWSLLRSASTLDNILTVYHDGSISWSGDQHHYQVKVENKESEVVHYLQIIGASHREAGTYQCMVSVFLDNVLKKLPSSNQLAVMVQNPESKLHLSSNPTFNGGANTDIVINCSVVSGSSQSSLYAVTWKLQQGGENKTILSSDRNGLVTYGGLIDPSDKQRVSMTYSKGPKFEFTIRQARTSDSGSYICEVEEWLQGPRGDWFQLSTMSRTTKLTVTGPVNDLRLDKKEQQIKAMEGEEVELQCNVLSDEFSSSFFYKVTWLYTARMSSSVVNASLAVLDHSGLLRYPENQALRGLQGRLRVSRPTASSFYLRIQKAHEGDSGTYWCQVEQYELDNEGRWQQKASESSGAISLSVNVAETNLVVAQKDADLNVSSSKEFDIPCNISRQSSNESTFQVTWFWQNKRESEKRPIFTAYRNSTLQDRFGRGVYLRYSHPLPREFILTVPKATPENSGLYFCEVEEWLPSLEQGWRRVSVQKSGKVTVNVSTEGGAEAVSECNSGTWIGVTVIIFIISLVVILLLVLKMCRSKVSGERKKGESLWAEQPLKPNATD